MPSTEPSPAVKIWLERKGQSILGTGGANLLAAINRLGNLTEAAKAVGMSYRYAWGYLRRIEQVIDKPIVIRQKGGAKGGGSMILTPLGRKLLRQYTRFDEFVRFSLNNPELWEAYGLEARATNRLPGRIESIRADKEVAAIKIAVPKGFPLIAIITRESVDYFQIDEGQHLFAVIKATEVMVEKQNED